VLKTHKVIVTVLRIGIEIGIEMGIEVGIKMGVMW
jgi:hypothetical protein